MAHFNEIPFEVFINAILPILSVADVGALAQVDTMWRDFAENKLVWKSLYLRLTPAKILDTSVHIGPKSARVRDRNGEYEILRNTGVTTTLYCPGLPFTPQKTFRCSNSTWFLNNSWCCNCMPQDLKSTLKSWREVQGWGDSDEFPWYGAVGVTRVTKPYCKYVNSEWREYNRKKGLSTTNLCQNPEHYSIDTLGTLEDCKNKRSFKKATLKIFEKEKKAILAKAAREKKAKLKKLEKACLVIQQLEQQLAEAEKIENQATKVFKNVSTGANLA